MTLTELRELRKGAIVCWDWMPRDGWGCIVPVPAVVTRIGVENVRIEVVRDDGKTVAKWVKPSTLFPYDLKCEDGE